ncbi:MAG: exonuclease SbcCD subunit D [Clostridia bacterium]|nr:exonuclease SbcCD subunit D [Clostridia bacterium]
MKLLHLADLHFGKVIYNHSLLEDQADWVEKIIAYIAKNRPDAVAIAGDVYDRGVPAREAIPLLTHLLTAIADMHIPVMVIAGNHDGGERLEFADSLLQRSDVYIAGTTRRDMVHFTRDFGDGFGPVTFWLMPYTFPAAIRQVLGKGDDDFSSYTDAVKALLEAQEIDFTARNVLIAHQTVAFGEEKPEIGRSCSAVGGVGCIDISVFEGFDYVALGHIHGHQKIGRGRIRYAGSPLCYHFDEASQAKGPLLVTLGEKGAEPVCTLETIEPLHHVRKKMVGTLEDIIAEETASEARNEYVEVELTSGEVSPSVRETLTSLFDAHSCRLLHISRALRTVSGEWKDEEEVSPEELPMDQLFVQFYRQQRSGEEPAPEDMALIAMAADETGHSDTDTLAQKLTDTILKQERDRT